MRLLNILKENNIIKVSPEDHLSHVLSKLSTSHDAAFVFDDNDKYLGVINQPFEMLYLKACQDFQQLTSKEFQFELCSFTDIIPIGIGLK